MSDPDFNLLVALDVLLSEGSVTGAARVLGLSASAMSRTLSRLRAATGDPLLVRAGQALVPTPYAVSLRQRVPGLAAEVRAVLNPAPTGVNVATLDRVFTVRANEGFVDAFAARLAATVTEAAPGVRLRFAPKPDKNVRALRNGLADLEIGVLGPSGPEVKVQALFQDRFIGVVRLGHPLASGEVTAARYAACSHVVASRRGLVRGPVDDALQELGLQRRVAVIVPSFPAVLSVVLFSDLVGLVTHSFVRAEQSRTTGTGPHCFELPVRTPAITVSQIWHPRADADPEHRWLRATVVSVCRQRQIEAERAIGSRPLQADGSADLD